MSDKSYDFNLSESENESSEKQEKNIVLLNNKFLFNLSDKYKPGENFYLHVNKKWIDNNPIPDAEKRWSIFDILREKSKKDVNGLLNEVTNCFNSKLLSKKSFFNDKPKIKEEEIELIRSLHISSRNSSEDKYSSQLKNMLSIIYNSKTKENLVNNIFNILNANGLEGPVVFRSYLDFENSNLNILHISYGGLGLPDRSYYFDDDKKDIVIEYKKFLKKYLMLFRNDITDEIISNIYEFEKKLAENCYTNIEKRDPNNCNNPTDYNNLISQFKFIGLKELANYLSKESFFQGKKLDKINVYNVKFLKSYENLFATTDLKILIDYYIWIFLLQVGSYLDENVNNIIYGFYGCILGGSNKMTERWERIVDIESKFLGNILSKIYVKAYFSEESKKKSYELINLIKDK